MYESGAHGLQQIEQALLADDPQFISRFRQAAQQLAATASDRPPGPIVVRVDGTLASMRAVEWAARWASASHAQIRIVHPFRPRSYPLDIGMEALQDLSGREAAEDICRSAVDLASAVAPASQCSFALVRDAEAPGLLRAADKNSLLVVGGPGPGALATLLHTGTLPQLLKRGRCPVAVLPCADTSECAPASSGRVSVLLDGSPGDSAAMAWGLKLADAHGCGVTIACPPGLASTAAATATLRTIRGQLPAPDVTWTTGSGPLTLAMAHLQSAPVAVVLDRSAMRIGGLWRGRAGRQLLRTASCPVLLTCTDDAARTSRS
jgi:nucleotide-binding universal stress UspA family protein